MGYAPSFFLKLLPRAEQAESFDMSNMRVYFTGHVFTSLPDDRSTSTGNRP